MRGYVIQEKGRAGDDALRTLASWAATRHQSPTAPDHR